MTHWTDKLQALSACSDAVEWACTQPDYETAWRTCQRGDWMLWLAGKLSGPPESEGRKTLVLAAADCAELALPFIHDEHVRAVSEATIEVSRAWACDAISIVLLREARDAASAYAASAAYAAYAAAATPACAAYASAYASAYAAFATPAYNDARTRVLAQCADLVRVWYPKPPVLP